MKVLQANKREEFISTKFKEFCNKREIKIKYGVFYIHKENGIAG